MIRRRGPIIAIELLIGSIVHGNDLNLMSSDPRLTVANMIETQRVWREAILFTHSPTFTSRYEQARAFSKLKRWLEGPIDVDSEAEATTRLNHYDTIHGILAESRVLPLERREVVEKLLANATLLEDFKRFDRANVEGLKGEIERGAGEDARLQKRFVTEFPYLPEASQYASEIVSDDADRGGAVLDNAFYEHLARDEFSVFTRMSTGFKLQAAVVARRARHPLKTRFVEMVSNVPDFKTVDQTLRGSGDVKRFVDGMALPERYIPDCDKKDDANTFANWVQRELPDSRLRLGYPKKHNPVFDTLRIYGIGETCELAREDLRTKHSKQLADHYLPYRQGVPLQMPSFLERVPCCRDSTLRIRTLSVPESLAGVDEEFSRIRFFCFAHFGAPPAKGNRLCLIKTKAEENVIERLNGPRDWWDLFPGKPVVAHSPQRLAFGCRRPEHEWREVMVFGFDPSETPRCHIYACREVAVDLALPPESSYEIKDCGKQNSEGLDHNRKMGLLKQKPGLHEPIPLERNVDPLLTPRPVDSGAASPITNRDRGRQGPSSERP